MPCATPTPVAIMHMYPWLLVYIYIYKKIIVYVHTARGNLQSIINSSTFATKLPTKTGTKLSVAQYKLV